MSIVFNKLFEKYFNCKFKSFEMLFGFVASFRVGIPKATAIFAHFFGGTGGGYAVTLPAPVECESLEKQEKGLFHYIISKTKIFQK